MAVMLKMWKAKWLTSLTEPTASFAGKNVIVTGANSGLGFEAAVKFSALDASKLILAVRDLKKGEAAKSAIEARTGKKNQIEVWELDMGSYESIQAFAEQTKQLDHVDVAVLNAGINKASHSLSKYGWEETIQINTISTVLLAILLLPKLKETRQITGQPPVIEFTGSGLHERVKLRQEARSASNILKVYNTPEAFGIDQYPISKLFLRFATNKLASKISSNDVIISTVCPGAVATGLTREYRGIILRSALFLFEKGFQRKPEEGAKELVTGTLQGESMHGAFWNEDIIKPLGPSLVGEENEKAAEQVWSDIIDALAKDVPAINGLVQALLS